VRLAVIHLGVVVAALSSLGGQSNRSPDVVTREMSITMDDLPGVSARDQSIEHFRRLTTGILDTFVKHHVPAIAFVNEGKLERNGAADPERVALLRQWIEAGFELGNHTYSHIDLHIAALADVEADVVRGEPVTRELMTRAGNRVRYFRHPFLHTGRSAETRQAFERFLTERGYRIAPVTVDNSDYIFAAAYDRLIAAGAHAQAQTLVDTYIDYMNRVVAFYEDQSQALLGRPIRQILLVHANALNARALATWLPMLAHRGYRFISLDRALEDEAYTTMRDEYFGTGGITWLHRWALTEGKRGAFFSGEPEVPAWVEQASQDAPRASQPLPPLARGDGRTSRAPALDP
jgi:peptidoglycan/xylan/chitin deacetylase (PgdA/CDA1 family)